MEINEVTGDLLARIQKVKLLGLDVDGVMTDGGIYIGAGDIDIRRFDSRDGVGIKLLQQAGLRIAIISGKKSIAVERRASELGIGDVVQGTVRKVAAMREIMKRHRLQAEEIAFVGDDLPDIPMFQTFGLGIAVADAAEEVKRAAHLTLKAGGGRGAVREAAEVLLRIQGKWRGLLQDLYEDA